MTKTIILHTWGGVQEDNLGFRVWGLEFKEFGPKSLLLDLLEGHSVES